VFQPTLPRARQIAADVILASDPDADRLGVMVADSSGEFEYVSGNRVGALLTDYILRRRGERRELSPAHYVVETLVTTPLIAAIARAAGVRAIDDLLVGFKYIAQTMDREGPDKFVFGAEESLGFLAGQYCRDKDAAVAALYLLELAAELKAQGRTLLDRLDELFAVHGYFVEGQRSEVCPGASGQLQIEALMRTLRRDPPPELAGARIEKVHDYGAHEIRQFPGNKRVADLVEPRANLMIFEAAAEGRRFRVAARPSGTEPKIKFYFFAQALPSSSQSMSQIKRETDAALAALQQALSEWVRAALARGVAAS
jgi:phosphoglucomutase/phosphomannomutase